MSNKDNNLKLSNHLSSLNQIRSDFQKAVSDEKSLIFSALNIIFKNNNFDELKIHLYNSSLNLLTDTICIDYLEQFEGEEVYNMDGKEKHIYRLTYETDKNFLTSSNKQTIYFPIRYKNNFYAVLSVSNSLKQKKKINQNIIKILCKYIDAIAIGIYNIRQSKLLYTNIETLMSISNITTSMISILDNEKILGLILESIIKVFHYDRVKLFLVNNENNSINGILSYDMKDKLKRISDEKYPLVYKKNKVLNTLLQKQIKMFGKNSTFNKIINFFPLKVRNKTIGFIQIDNIYSQQIIDSTKIKFLKLYINQASIAIENTALYNEIEKLALMDGLTGLYTSRHFYEQLKHQLNLFIRYQTECSVIMMDLDDFKAYNDNYGHIVGDKVLKEVAKVIINNIRESDIAARYGGDEFSIILVNIKNEDALKVADRICKSIKEINIKVKNNKIISISSSIGITHFTEGINDSKKILEIADKALYVAKEKGKNRVFYLDSREYI